MVFPNTRCIDILRVIACFTASTALPHVFLEHRLHGLYLLPFCQKREVQQRLIQRRLERQQWKLDTEALLRDTSTNCFDRTQTLNSNNKHDTKQTDKTVGVEGAAEKARDSGVVPAFVTAGYGIKAPPFCDPSMAMSGGGHLSLIHI